MVLVGVFSACQIGGGIKRGTIHPTAENIPEATHPDLTIDLTDPSAWEEKPPLVDTSLFASVDYGGEDGPFEQLLSWARDVAYDGDSTIFVLDADPRRDAPSSTAKVHVVRTDGTLLSTFGRRGEGPGEFRNAEHLLIRDAGNQVLVLGSESHIEVYNRQAPGQFQFARQIRIPFGVTDACIMNDFLYVLRYDADSGTVIQKLSLEGEVVASFGVPYQSENLVVVQSLSNRGDLVCNESHDLLGYVPRLIPAFVVFTSTGQLHWRLTIRGIKPTHIVEEGIADKGGASVRYIRADREESGRGRIFPIVALGNGDFYIRTIVRTGIDSSRSLIFRLNAQSGQWAHVADGFLTGIMEDNFIAYIFMGQDGATQLRILTRK